MIDDKLIDDVNKLLDGRLIYNKTCLLKSVIKKAYSCEIQFSVVNSARPCRPQC